MRVVIVGTGTNVGKTHLGVALVAAAAARGWGVCGLKPIESGVPAGSVGADAEALAGAGTFHVKQPPPYVLVDAVSPHLAARRAGVVIELERVRRWVDEHTASWVFVETAGGLLSPLSAGVANLDLAAALEPDRVLLVGVDRLGVLHDVSACRIAMSRSIGIAPLVVLEAPEAADSSTGTNAEELREVGIAADVVTMPRGAPRSAGCQEVASRVLEWLQRGGVASAGEGAAGE
jgi:dethiobiotin synthetase